jgi:molybdopterin/thiamine biosynthesis adenylyltransferase
MATLNLAKSYDFFKPEDCQERIHIIGCGSVGSTVAELLVRFGLTKITLYDFDTVEPKNLANQMFRQEHVSESKVEALSNIIAEINPEVKANLKIQPYGFSGQRLSGYVFLCVDNIELRREIAVTNKSNPYIKAMFDFRTRLTDAQHYAADWSDTKMVDDFINSMNFTHDEATAETPMSACNVTLSVAPTVRIICSLGVANFVNFVKSANGGRFKKFVQIDTFNFILDAF